MSTYQSFQNANYQNDGDIDEDIDDDDDDDENPHEAGVLIHVPESDRSNWGPIEDLDSFFTRIYHYHQKHGFLCMILQEFFELGQFAFVAAFTFILFHCINYPILFRDEETKNKNSTKVSIEDALLPWEECVKSMGAITWILIIIAVLFWLLRLIKVLCDCVHYWDIKKFYNTALNICDSELDNLTWHEVQKRLKTVQKEHEMCIHKKDLTELDIYHRILRFKNYMVAMVNKSLIPVQLKIPFYGNVIFFSRGLKYNIELLLFRGPFAPFDNNWQLKEEYKKVNKRNELAANLSKHIFWFAVINFVLCPVILLWQIMHSFFTYAEMIKREPESLGSRCWSLHGRLYLRHFNELDHELNARLNRAYRPATKYMNIFTSPIMTIIAKNVGFISGAILAVLLALTVYDEDVITVEHVLTTMTVLGGILAASRVFIPDENLVWCPEQLMTAVLAHVHYLPESWRGKAHTQTVHSQFSQIFQYKAEYLIQELISPLVTPYILYFRLRRRAIDIVDFYRQFTVEVVGVGDVCSFAQMDIRKHGNPDWQPEDESEKINKANTSPSPQFAQAEDGKTELSLIHFTLTNPNWRPPADAENFVEKLKAQAIKDAEMLELNTAGFNNPLCTSLHSISSLGVGYNIFATSFLRQSFRPEGERRPSKTDKSYNPLNVSQSVQNYNATSMQQSIRGGLRRLEGPGKNERGDIPGNDQSCNSGPQSLALGLRGFIDPTTSLGASVFGSGPDIILRADQIEQTPADMALSTLYLHELHHRQIGRRSNYQTSEIHSPWRDSSPIRGEGGSGGGGIVQETTSAKGENSETDRKNEKLPLLKK
ncbi:conserved hypothetical protein [Pediculus humanus corporis]|uniref:Autophagy-related protein 9 n=1 Tax=Pediculus humanus subsp. corporis TaxID=121224 RepID=E0W1J0_PEDHC|nr:uncharacterized protein Phum_PHUM577780 [Pediculus humanus corporis]EEB19496.1 conserved hypothetical protein [Pediculus humanus corporis]